MKRVFLLYPPITKQERYSSSIGNSGGEQIPLGIYYLASFLKENGYDIKVVDAEANKLTEKDILEVVKKFKPDILGISSTTVAFHRALSISKLLKKQDDRVKIVLGGPHISSNVNHAMSFSSFDYGILREGEITFLEFLKNFDSKDFFTIKGLAYRVDGKLVVNEPREYIKNLDTLPFPDYSQIKDIGLYSPPPSNYKTLPVVNIITSRGCPFECTFCDRNVFGQNIRYRSAENVFKEIKFLYNKYKVREIAFVDDTFLLRRKRVYKLFKLLDDQGINIHWTCMTRINSVDYEYLQYIKSKGCWHISFGIESGNQEIIDCIKKGIKLENVGTIIDFCWKLKIKTKGFFIIGHPKETIKTIDQTIDFALKLNLDDIVCTINTPIPGSPQYEMMTKYGTCDKSDWSKFNYWTPVFVPFGLTKDILLKKQKKFFRKFYFRPRILVRYGMSILGKGGVKRLISLLKSFFFFFETCYNSISTRQVELI